MTLPAASKVPNWISQLKGWAKGKLLLRFRIQNVSVKLQIKFHGWPLSGWRYRTQANGVGRSPCPCKQTLQLPLFRDGTVGGTGVTIKRITHVFLQESDSRLLTHTNSEKESRLTHGVWWGRLWKFSRFLRGNETHFPHTDSLYRSLSHSK